MPGLFPPLVALSRGPTLSDGCHRHNCAPQPQGVPFAEVRIEDYTIEVVDGHGYEFTKRCTGKFGSVIVDLLLLMSELVN
jgi:hypothetical protein